MYRTQVDQNDIKRGEDWRRICRGRLAAENSPKICGSKAAIWVCVCFLGKTRETTGCEEVLVLTRCSKGPRGQCSKQARVQELQTTADERSECLYR